MQIRLVVSVLSVAFAVGAQFLSVLSSSATDTEVDSALEGTFQTPPSTASSSLTDSTTVPSSAFASTPDWKRVSGLASPTSFSYSSSSFESASVSKGPIIAAAVGASIAASLVVLAIGLFCIRIRIRPRPPRAAERASDDVAHRCTALEREVTMLRERLVRLEAREACPRSGGALLYTNEKDGEALDGKAAKDHPPTYVD
ncbi:hypothetical protein B0H12DRAFT_1231893 [Mycena haematopus]|nr:hypothetical protein B0H12DRAFT_1231893 [Mycena haematopus]